MKKFVVLVVVYFFFTLFTLSLTRAAHAGCLAYFDASSARDGSVSIGAAGNCEVQVNPRLSIGGAVSLYHLLPGSVTDLYVTATITPGRRWIMGGWVGVGVRWSNDLTITPSLRQFIFVTREGVAPMASLFLVEGLEDPWVLVQVRVGIKSPAPFGSIRTGFQLTWDDVLHDLQHPIPGIFGAVFFN